MCTGEHRHPIYTHLCLGGSLSDLETLIALYGAPEVPFLAVFTACLPLRGDRGYTLIEPKTFLKMPRCTLKWQRFCAKASELHLPCVTARLSMQQQQVADYQ